MKQKLLLGLVILLMTAVVILSLGSTSRVFAAPPCGDTGPCAGKSDGYPCVCSCPPSTNPAGGLTSCQGGKCKKFGGCPAPTSTPCNVCPGDGGDDGNNGDKRCPTLNGNIIETCTITTTPPITCTWVPAVCPEDKICTGSIPSASCVATPTPTPCTKCPYGTTGANNGDKRCAVGFPNILETCDVGPFACLWQPTDCPSTCAGTFPNAYCSAPTITPSSTPTPTPTPPITATGPCHCDPGPAGFNSSCPDPNICTGTCPNPSTEICQKLSGLTVYYCGCSTKCENSPFPACGGGCPSGKTCSSIGASCACN